ncbi:MAG: tRNA (adenosine(37)-N6)-threonylcarbamoyltransferase complex ATPase subunit type 1 TsaE, partial [Candidatus Cloacimonetes bacterium]|nr:tRNA (adenosine(37)-N6)-threonylcarbamoyltransferase complex ATPase subunit type 1 TsaE [Candidatus Cloacimonadota bacterium]
MTKRIDLNSEQDTIDLAYYIGPIIGPGAIISLFGELGSGKTFFVKALGAFLGISEDIDSPSFVLFKEYHCGRFPLYHLDLYRLKHEDELLDLGLLDASIIMFTSFQILLSSSRGISFIIQTCSLI